MYNDIIIEYGKKPVNKFKIKDFNIRYWEENGLCGDSIEVFIKVEGNKIIDWSFEGNTSIITTACASIFGESIIGLDFEELFKLDENYIKNLIGIDVSQRRKQASVLGLLATRNALHEYKKDGIIDDFSDLIKIND